MYLDTGKVRSGNKVYTRVLLRESYREDGKVKHRTIANLSQCSDQEIAAIKLALQHKHDLASWGGPNAPLNAPLTLRQGSSIGAVAVLEGLARELGLVKALGTDRHGKLALWQVIARVIDQGSRLRAVRLAQTHACCDWLKLDAFNEDDLYANLAWLTEHQQRIERRLFDELHPGEKPALFLYDVTSSYLEGCNNHFGTFGYNRDGKSGKMQIVIGLLCDQAGIPLSIEVFAGNTSDPKTVASQVKKVVAHFGGGSVTFVGDRGMLKIPQIEHLSQQGMHYITAITKPQIESLLDTKVLQMELFDQSLAEVSEEKVRYVLRRNPKRAAEMEAIRADKLSCLEHQVSQSNAYLSAHPRANAETVIKTLSKKVEKLKLQSWVEVKCGKDRGVTLQIDESARNEQIKLDGCYVLKTDLSAAQASKELVHDRYKDLTLVEQAFRTSKTVELQMRPIYVQVESSTRGHALVVLLAYRLVHELGRRWQTLDVTVQEGLKKLSTLCAVEVVLADQTGCLTIPEPSADVAKLIKLAGVTLPTVFRSRGVKVATRKKLQENRSSR
jgi:transposase